MFRSVISMLYVFLESQMEVSCHFLHYFFLFPNFSNLKLSYKTGAILVRQCKIKIICDTARICPHGTIWTKKSENKYHVIAVALLLIIHKSFVFKGFERIDSVGMMYNSMTC